MLHPAAAPQAVPTMEYGLLASRRDSETGSQFTVRTQHGCYTARKAKSCLLSPEQGDTVLLSSDDLGNCFILAVLEGPSQSGCLEHQGDLRLQVSSGSLSLAAEEQLEISADSLHLTARTGSAAMQRFSLLAEAISGQCKTLNLVADACRQSMRTLTQRLGSFFRATEGHEEIQANTSRTMVEDTRVLHCKNSLLMAEEDARIDAEQIQLG